MLRLNTVKRSLELVLAAPPTVTQPSFLASWSNPSTSKFTGGSTPGVANGVTPVTIVDAPGSSQVREIDYVSILNSDSSPTTVTVQYRDDATVYPIITITLPIGSQLQYTGDSGWITIDKDGNIRSGTTGPIGLTGSQGPDGISYAFTVEGPEGEQGMPGVNGPPGIQGITGNVGPSGPAIFLVAPDPEEALPGAPGQQGLQGIQGTPGQGGQAIYLVGDEGEPGDIGPRGDRGIQGITGPQGPMGVTLIIEAEEGPMGMPGIPGVSGIQGLTGAQGPIGPAMFLEGEPGERGDPGQRGRDGANGSNGAQGNPGVSIILDGNDGEDGVPGPRGATGSTGLTGATGPTGPATHFLVDQAGEVLEPILGGPGGGVTAPFNPAADPMFANVFFNKGLVFAETDGTFRSPSGPSVLFSAGGNLEFYQDISGYGTYGAPVGMRTTTGIPKFRVRTGDTIVETQYALDQLDIARFLPIGNSNTAITLDRMNAVTAVGTATARNVANTNQFTKSRRIGYVSSAAAGNLAGFYYGTAQWASWDNSNGAGGFQAVFTFGCSDAATVSGARSFVGVSASVGAPTNVEPDTLVNAVGVAQLSTDSTQLYFIVSGSSAQTAIACGTDFPPGSLSTDIYTLKINVNINGGVTLELLRGSPIAHSFEVATSVSGGNAVTTPAASTFLAPRAWRCNNATALAVGIDIMQMIITNTAHLS